MNIHNHSNVRWWVCCLYDEKAGTKSIADKLRSGCSFSSVNPVNKAKADTPIKEDRRTTLDELAENLGVIHGSAYNIVESLGFSKVCVPVGYRKADYRTQD